MNCPVCKKDNLRMQEIEPDLFAEVCEVCNGKWISSENYEKWLEQHGAINHHRNLLLRQVRIRPGIRPVFALSCIFLLQDAVHPESDALHHFRHVHLVHLFSLTRGTTVYHRV